MSSKRICFRVLFCVITMLFVLSVAYVSAEDYGDFSLQLPEGYKSSLKSESKSEIADIVGIEEKEIENYFSDGKLEFLAVDDDNTSQIKLSVLEDDFSKKIISFNNLDNERLLGLANSFFTGSYESVSKNTVVVNNNGNKYLKYKEKLEDSGGEYTVTQFITVCGSKTYRLSVSYTEKDGENLDTQIFKTFKIKEKDQVDILIKTVLIIAVLVFSVIIVSTVISIYKNDKLEKENEE